MSFEIVLILVLVIANGVFSMAEMAVVSARKARLRQRADEGSHSARVALDLAERPDDFLSTVQVGITMIGTLAGAFGGATVADKLAAVLVRIPTIAPYAGTVALVVVVLMITYLSLILGELVPKNLALGNPEGIASALAPPMRWLSKAASPVVRFLSFSTRLVMKLLPVNRGTQAPVTEEEVKVLIAQGTEHGAFHEAEQEMVEGVFRLGDLKVIDLIRPRNKLTWLDVEDNWDVNARKISASPYSRFLVAEGGLDQLIGVVHVRDLFLASRTGAAIDLRVLARKPFFIPDTTPALNLLDQFQRSGEELAVVVDEHGGVEGIVTVADLTGAVVGDLGSPAKSRPRIVQREDGSWLADGSMPIVDLLDRLELRELPGQGEDFTTLGGFVLARLHRIPQPGAHFTEGGLRFEVLDMDGNRVDKVLIQANEDATGPLGA